MSRWLAGLCFVASAALAGCAPCRSISDCDPGSVCNFDTGDCMQGCRRDDDCGGTSVCNPATGICTFGPDVVLRRDAAVPDVGTSSTSSTADAGS